MMSFHEIKEAVSKISFLNYEFLVNENHFPDICLSVRFNAPDSEDRSKKTVVKIDQIFYDGTIEDKEFLSRVLFDIVMKTLRHEAGELFFVDGETPFNEHTKKDVKFIKEMMQ